MAVLNMMQRKRAAIKRRAAAGEGGGGRSDADIEKRSGAAIAGKRGDGQASESGAAGDTQGASRIEARAEAVGKREREELKAGGAVREGEGTEEDGEVRSDGEGTGTCEGVGVAGVESEGGRERKNAAKRKQSKQGGGGGGRKKVKPTSFREEGFYIASTPANPTNKVGGSQWQDGAKDASDVRKPAFFHPNVSRLCTGSSTSVVTASACVHCAPFL